MEKVTRSLWAPAADGSGQETRWFYERARGQYADALARERTPARQRAFKTIHPLRQKFTKSDAAKFEHSWAQLPHIVSRGAEKNFREFMIRLAEKTPAVERVYCQRLIAKAILFRSTEKIVTAQGSAATARTSSPTPSRGSRTTPASASTSTASGVSRSSPPPSQPPSTT